MELRKNPARGPWRGIAATVIAAALLFSSGLNAAANPLDDQKKQNDRNISASQSAINDIEIQLAQDEADLAGAQEDAAIAAEDYNRSIDDLEAAKVAEDEAKAAASVASDKREIARKELAALVVSSYQSEGGISKAKIFLTDGGIDDVVTRSTVFNALGTKADRAYQSYAATTDLATTADRRAREAVDTTTKAAASLKTMKDAADAATATAAAKFAETSGRKESAAAELAQYRQTSVGIENQRIAQAEADRVARAEAAAEAERNRPVVPPAAGGGTGGNSGGSTGGNGGGTGTPGGGTGGGTGGGNTGGGNTGGGNTGGGNTGGGNTGGGNTGGSTSPGRSTAAQGQAALEWARAQIGKPYVWAAVGPNSFDCSGLTMMAWRKGGGISPPRTSRDQYNWATKISYDSMRPGDLIFWSKNPSNPSQIYHVAMIAGNGQMVEAPKPGDVVKLTKIRWANTMPYAGRV